MGPPRRQAREYPCYGQEPYDPAKRLWAGKKAPYRLRIRRVDIDFVWNSKLYVIYFVSLIRNC